MQIKLGRTKTASKAAAPANESATTGHVDKHGGQCDATSADNTGFVVYVSKTAKFYLW